VVAGARRPGRRRRRRHLAGGRHALRPAWLAARGRDGRGGLPAPHHRAAPADPPRRPARGARRVRRGRGVPPRAGGRRDAPGRAAGATQGPLGAGRRGGPGTAGASSPAAAPCSTTSSRRLAAPRRSAPGTRSSAARR
jgi:hypothetical protein